MNLTLNPNAFLFLEDNLLNVFVSNKNTQYILSDPKYIKRLLSIHLNSIGYDPKNKIDHDLFEANIITPQPQNLDSWEGDKISLFSHYLSRINSNKYPENNQETVVQDILTLGNGLDELPDRFFPLSILGEIVLPDPDPTLISGKDLLNILLERKTSRNFESKPISLEVLSTILYYSLKINPHPSQSDLDENGFEDFVDRRTSPSSTGLQACDAFLTIFNVDKVEPGIYFYDAINHKIVKTGSQITYEDLSYLLTDQFWSNGISVGIFLIYDMRRVWIKDKNIRGYLTSYLDTGHISQTILLLSTHLKLRTWITGSFRDDKLLQTLSLESPYIFPSFFIGLGFGDDSAVPRNFTCSKV